jgi:hypothetical protein
MIAQREAQRKEIIAKFVVAFRGIYDQYEQFKYNEALSAGRPPPVKKMRLASNSASPVASPNPTPVGLLNSPIGAIVHVSATVHRKDVDAKGYTVPQPHVYVEDFVGADEDEDASDGSKLESKTFFLTRTRCANCVTAEEEAHFERLPEYITWTDSRSVPDGCPVCQKVLFKKAGSRLDDDF